MIGGEKRSVITIKTYQDLVEVGQDEKQRRDFVLQVVNEHRGSKAYKMAATAREYYRGKNTTIVNYNKYVRDAFGKLVPDIWSANHKLACHYYGYLVRQLALFLLGNGVSFNEDSTKDKLGKDFDKVCVEILIDALNGGVAYGFANKDKVEHFSVLDFAPLLDEETGHLRAGVRFWQLDEAKPLRLTLYEEDGYTEFIRRQGEDLEELHPKEAYIEKVQSSDATGEISTEGMNYPSFPIVPLYNSEKQSELEGNRELHDAMDLMLSGLVNNVDDGAIVYWLLKNSGGFDQPDMNRFIQTLKATHVAMVDSDDDVIPHSPIVQFQASEAAIAELRRQIFDNHMGFDAKQVQAGAATATEIRAAYEPLNSKADLLEFHVTEFIHGILDIFGIEDEPSYTRSYIVNQNESIQTVLSAGTVLPQEYQLKKVLEILGDIDRVDEVQKMAETEEMERFEQAVAMSQLTAPTAPTGGAADGAAV